MNYKDKIEEILRRSDSHTAVGAETYSLTKKEGRDELLKLMEEYATEARIDEAEKAYWGWRGDYSEFEVWHENRIQQLLGETND